MKEETKLFNKRNVTSFLLLLALSVHAFFEGLALGLIDAEREIFYILIAISFHKCVEALSIGINLNKSKIDKDVLMVLIVLFSLTTPAGIILGIIISGMSPIFEAIFLSISAGTFLYISASEVIVEEFSVGGNKFLKFLGFLLGFVIIALFTIFEYI
jgi:solute carrier family 39 (zinc transporter), member 1/2/3